MRNTLPHYFKGRLMTLLLLILLPLTGHAQVLVQDFDDLQDLNQFQGSPPDGEQVDKINLTKAGQGSGEPIFSLGTEGTDQFLKIDKVKNQFRHFGRNTGLNDESFLRISFDFAIDSSNRAGNFAKFYIGDDLNDNSIAPDKVERWAEIGIKVDSEGGYYLTHEVLNSDDDVFEWRRTDPYSEEKRISIIASNSEEDTPFVYTGPDKVPYTIDGGEVHIWVGKDLLEGPALKGSSSSISAVKFLTGATHDTTSARLDNLSITTDIEMDPLPVDLLHFSAQAEQEDVHLSWSTASEVNSSHFDIERSLDGKIFTTIGQLGAVGNSKATLHYAFIDKMAGSLAGMVYYRLHQVDHDGASTYGPLVQFLLPEKKSVISDVFPNPFYDELEVQVLTDKDIMLKFRLLMVQGRVVMEAQKLFKSSGQEQLYRIPFSEDISPGIYMLEITNGKEVWKQRVVKL